MSKDIWTFKDTLAGKILTMVMSVILVTSTISTDALAFALNNPDADAAPVADVAESTKVAFEISEGASVEVAGADGQPVAVKNGDVVEAPSHEAFHLCPAAEKGYTLESVTLGDKALEAKEDGKYEIAADDMADDPLTVKVKAQAEVEAAPEEAPVEEEPVAEEAPAEEEEPAAEEAADPADAVAPEEAKTVEQDEIQSQETAIVPNATNPMQRAANRASSSSRVYIYLKINNKTITGVGNKVNAQGYYTIGYIDVPNLPNAQYGNAGKYQQTVVNYLNSNLDKVVRYGNNKDMPIANVNWGASGFGLIVADGATDYGNEAPSGTSTWHLDGYLDEYPAQVVTKSLITTYDGTEKTVSGFVGETDRGVPISIGGQTFYVTGLKANAKGTNANTYEVETSGTPRVKNSSGTDVTNYFNITIKKGSLTINKRSVTLTSASLDKEYDGTALTNGDTDLATETGWVDGQGATYTFTGSQTLVGNSANAFSYTLNEGTDANNYTITKSEGTLTVNSRNAKYEVTVVANSTTDTYDGTEKTASGFKNETEQGIPVEANDQTYYVTGLTSSATGTNVADSQVTIPVSGTAVVKDAAGNDVSDQFKVTVTPGSLTINKRSVTLTSASDSKIYDGTALTNNTVTVSGDIFADGEGATYTVTGSQTDVGTSKNDFTYTLNSASKASNTLAGNYEIKQVMGTLTVWKQSINPTDPTDPDPTDPDKPVYNGVQVGIPEDTVYNGFAQEQKPAVTDKNSNALVEGTDYELRWENNVNAGTATVVVTGINNYGGEVVRTFTIAPRPVLVTANDTGKTYGDEDPELAATPGKVGEDENSGLIGNETVEFTVSRQPGEDAGTYTITPTGEENQGNYYVTYASGTFTIAAAGTNIVTDVNLAGAEGTTKVYDGTASTITATAAVAGSTFEYSFDGTTWTSEVPSFTSAGTYPVWVRANAANYDTTPAVRATVTITPAPVTITVADANKVAGQADPAFVGTVSGLVNQTDLGIVRYYRTNDAEAVGTYPNVLSATFTANPNYVVNVQNGTFTITALPAPVFPAPTTPATPGITPAGPAAPAGPATPGGGPAAAVAIDDAPTPLAETPAAEPEETTIAADAVPMAAAPEHEQECWVHMVMIAGIVLTLIYAAAVAVRRMSFTSKLKKREDDFTGEGTDAEDYPETSGMTPHHRVIEKEKE